MLNVEYGWLDVRDRRRGRMLLDVGWLKKRKAGREEGWLSRYEKAGVRR